MGKTNHNNNIKNNFETPPNYKREFNRVDIFRTAHFIHSNNENNNLNTFRMTNSTNPDPNKNKEYSNNAYVKSNDNLNFTNLASIQREPQVWTTSGISVLNHASNENKLKKGETENDETSCCSCSTKTIIIIVVVSVLILLILAGVGIGLGVYFSQSKTGLKECLNICGTNEYCVLGATSSANATCNCKPGYTRNDFSKQCIQTSCYTNYVPYTYLNSQPPQTPTAYDTQFLKPFCCPNSLYLTDACCGVASLNTSFKLSKRIIGGAQLDAGVFPWVVFVTQVYRSNPSLPLSMFKNCTGTLINDRYVLTAAHCLDLSSQVTFNSEFPNISSIVRVYFGFVDRSKALQASTMSNYERRVVKLIQHPEFNEFLDKDLGILKLDKPVLRDINTDYLCLFNYDLTDNLLANQKLYVAGWGSINPSANNLVFPDVINYVDLAVRPMDQCKYIDANNQFPQVFDSKTKICAGFDASIAKDSCAADSGGPLMVQVKSQWFLYGIVSFGSYPDCAKGPAIYTRIAYFYSWILQNISN